MQKPVNGTVGNRPGSEEVRFHPESHLRDRAIEMKRTGSQDGREQLFFVLHVRQLNEIIREPAAAQKRQIAREADSNQQQEESFSHSLSRSR